jgi:hypothetical protein
MRGYRHSPATRAKISLGLRRYYTPKAREAELIAAYTATADQLEAARVAVMRRTWGWHEAVVLWLAEERLAVMEARLPGMWRARFLREGRPSKNGGDR